MRIKIILLSGLLALVLVGGVQAQDALERDPGYVNFADIEGWFPEEATLEVNIKGALLKLVAEASRNEDPDLAVLLRRLKAIQVRGYNMSAAQFTSVERHASELARRLETRGWETVARVREDDERVDMYLRMLGDNIAGLVVMVVSPGENETVFVNIVGDIDPEQIGRIGRKFDIGGLDGAMVRRGADKSYR